MTAGNQRESANFGSAWVVEGRWEGRVLAIPVPHDTAPYARPSVVRHGCRPQAPSPLGARRDCSRGRASKACPPPLAGLVSTRDAKSPKNGYAPVGRPAEASTLPEVE